MKALLLLFLFVGVFMVTHGVYEQKLKSIAGKTKIEYRFIPRSLYDEQLGAPTTSADFKDLFQKDAPWEARYSTDMPSPDPQRTSAASASA